MMMMEGERGRKWQSRKMTVGRNETIKRKKGDEEGLGGGKEGRKRNIEGRRKKKKRPRGLERRKEEGEGEKGKQEENDG